MVKLLSNKKVIALFVLPGVLLFAMVFVYPIIYTINLSFTSWRGVGGKEYIGFSNYTELFHDKVFLLSVKNTMCILGIALAGQLIPALFFAILLSNLKRGTRFFRIVFFIPVLLSSTAIALMWGQIYNSNYGMLNALLRMMGLESWMKDWLSDPATCLTAVIIPVIWQWIGYHLIIMYSGLKAIPDQYIEAARLDGATNFQVAVRIIIPMMQDVIKVCVILAAVGSIKIFDNIYIMTAGGPYNLTATIAIKMYNEAFLKMNFGYGSAIVVILCIICMAVFLFINKVMNREAIEY